MQPQPRLMSSGQAERIRFVPAVAVTERQRQRAPAIPVVASAALGIAIDRVCDLDVRIWLGLSILFLAAWGLAFVRHRLQAGAILLLCGCAAAGAGWHHCRWSLARSDHLATFATEEPVPVRLAARVVNRPILVPQQAPQPYAAFPQSDRTLCTIDCQALLESSQPVPVSGLARLEVAGHLPDVEAGDAIELVGRFSRPAGARNPGGFDFRQYLRANGLHVVVRCEQPADLQVVSSANSWWRQWHGRLRDQCERLLLSQLSDRTAPVGTALLLGTRTGMPDELRDAFAASGTTHILAISGANVGILALLLGVCCRILNFSRPMRIVVPLAVILGYAVVADAQPPVVRAVLMIVAALAGAPWYRRGGLVNGLAAAALCVLAWNPMHLFDIGAQLSFLAVSALIWAAAWHAHWIDAAPRLDLAERPTAARRVFRLVSAEFRLAWLATAAVWLFTLPLTMARFHLFSPIGFAINVLLGPLVFVMLGAGYALLLVGLLIPPLAPLFGVPFEWTLQGLIGLVEWSAHVPLGHLHLPGPAGWWLAGFYAGLAGASYGAPGGRLRHWGWRLMLAWCVLGLAARLAPAHSPGLRCTFLSVGHGVSVLVELPGGKCLLYDAGQLQDGERARQTVQNALWERGLSRAHVVVISHADVDHFNGLPGLSETIGLGCVLVHPSFLDFGQPSVQALCEQLAERKVPIRLAWAGDSIQLDPDVSLRFLHPRVRRSFRDDNANSLVLAIEYAGRVILLTGDLEKDGLQSLLREPPVDADVLLAPHHGSPAANPRELAEWAQPEWVIVSGGRRDSAEKLHPVYGTAVRVLSTHDSGAVTFEVTQDGTIREQAFLNAAD